MTTGFFDKNGKEIKVGDTCKAFDRKGKKWIGKIIFENNGNINNNGSNKVFVFMSNYGTWIDDKYAKKLEVIN